LSLANLCFDFRDLARHRPLGAVGPASSLDEPARTEFAQRFATVIAEFPVALRPRLEALLQSQIRTQPYELSFNVYATLAVAVRWTPEFGDTLLSYHPIEHSWLFLSIESGRLKADPGLFFAAFLPALEQIDPHRIGRCEFCERLFYALRRPGEYGTKACSDRCNLNRRMRKFRDPQSRSDQAAAKRFRRKAKVPALRGRERTVKLELNRAFRDEEESPC
jgi:hypothetical protein